MKDLYYKICTKIRKREEMMCGDGVAAPAVAATCAQQRPLRALRFMQIMMADLSAVVVPYSSGTLGAAAVV